MGQEQSSNSSGKGRFLPYIVVAAVVCVFLGPVLFGGRVLLPGGLVGKMSPWNVSAPNRVDVYWNVLAWDSNAEYLPSRAFLGRALRSGEIPLWNPYQFSGYPFLADMLSAALYPPNLLYAVLPPAIALGILAALHLLAAGIFTFLFLRGLQLSRSASTFGAIAFMLSGFSVAWLELPVFISVAAWLPLTLHLSRLAHERKSIYYASGAGLSVAMSLLGGHPQVAFYSMMTVGLYWVYLGISQRKEVSIWTAIALGIVTFGVGLALASPQLLPMLELASLSHRGVQPPTPAGYAAYVRLAMPIGHLITVLIPDFFGNPSKGTYWGYNEYTEYCSYVGIFTLLLIPFAFTRRKDGARQPVWFFGALGLLGILMALGTDVNKLFYYHIPGFTKAGSPARVLFLFVFAASVLAAFGMDRIMERGREKSSVSGKGVLFVGLGILIACGWLLRIILSQMTGDVMLADLLQQRAQEIKMFAAFFVLGLGVLLLIQSRKLSRPLGIVLVVGMLCADMISFGYSYNATCTQAEAYPPTQLTDFLKKDADYSRMMPLNDQWSLREIPHAVLPPNSAMMYGLYDVSGYDSLYPRAYKALVDAASGQESCPRENGNMIFARNPGSPVYDLLGVRWVISRKLVENARKIDGCYVYRNDEACPRAFIVHGLEYTEESDLLARLTSGHVSLRNTALVTFDDASGIISKVFSEETDDTPRKTGGTDYVKITRYMCNTVDIEATAGKEGYLILTDQYYPGWECTVDGKFTPIMRVDYDFRGVPLKPGAHKVRFSYEPESYHKGLGIAGMAMMFLAILSLIGITTRKKSPEVNRSA